MEMTHKSHLALILPIAIRGPRETKNSKQIFEFPWDTNPTASGLLTDLQKTSLFYYIYHYEVSNVIMQTVNNVGCKAYRLWGLKGLAGFFGSSLASGNEELPRVAKEYCLFDFLSLIFRAPSLKVFCWPQHCTFLDQFHRDFNINNLNFFFFRFIGTDPNAPITTRITFASTSHIFRTSLATSWYWKTLLNP